MGRNTHPNSTLVSVTADQHEALEAMRCAAGKLRGKHHTEYVSEAKALKRAGDYPGAARLLLRMLDAVEAESRAAGPAWPVAPWCYEQLAGIHRKAKNYREEVAILRRYVDQHEGKAEGPFPNVTARLVKAEAMLAGHARD